jgi:hypothetical protein
MTVRNARCGAAHPNGARCVLPAGHQSRHMIHVPVIRLACVFWAEAVS